MPHHNLICIMAALLLTGGVLHLMIGAALAVWSHEPVIQLEPSRYGLTLIVQGAVFVLTAIGIALSLPA